MSFALALLCTTQHRGLVADALGAHNRPAGARAHRPRAHPTTLFSSGLYNTMPFWMYDDVLRAARRNATIVQATMPLTRASFEHACDAMAVDTVPLIAHSAIDVEVLRSDRLARALLIDPAVRPSVSSSLSSRSAREVVTPKVPVTIVESALYSGFVPKLFQPVVLGAHKFVYSGGGHADILNPQWAALAESFGIPSQREHRFEYQSFVGACIRDWVNLHA